MEAVNCFRCSALYFPSNTKGRSLPPTCPPKSFIARTTSSPHPKHRRSFLQSARICSEPFERSSETTAAHGAAATLLDALPLGLANEFLLARPSCSCL